MKTLMLKMLILVLLIPIQFTFILSLSVFSEENKTKVDEPIIFEPPIGLCKHKETITTTFGEGKGFSSVKVCKKCRKQIAHSGLGNVLL